MLIFYQFAFSVDCRPLDVVFLIDGSGSETNDSFRDQLEFMEEIVQTSGLYNKNTHFGAVSFSSKARLEFNLNQYSSNVDRILAIRNITQSGKFTRLENGFEFVTNISFTKDGGDRPDVDNVLIVMTDGIFHPENASEPAEILLGKGVKIVLILFTNNMTDRLTNNAQSITDLKNTYTKNTFEPLELFCPSKCAYIVYSMSIIYIHQKYITCTYLMYLHILWVFFYSRSTCMLNEALYMSCDSYAIEIF